MSKHFFRDYSLKSFENEEHTTYEKNAVHNLPNFFSMANDRKQNYSEKSFQCHYTTKPNKNKNEESLLCRVNSSSYMSLNKSKSRKPLNDLLKSNKDDSLHNKTITSKQKKFYRPSFTQTNELNFQKLKAMSAKKSRSKDPHQNQIIQFQKSTQSSDQHLSLIRLRESVKNVKTLQSQMKHSKSRSCSGKKKGLECTLYEKSLEKKINESGIKSSKKLITIKKRFERTEAQWGKDEDIPQKDIKRILLKKKNNQTSFNNTNCFNSVILTRSKDKRVEKLSKQKANQHFDSSSKPKIGQNIRSVSKNKKQSFSDLNKSMNLLKKACKNQQFTNRLRSIQKSIQKARLSSKKQNISSKKHESLRKSSKSKKLLINERIQSNLNKVHQKYKFILNYLTDFDIIGKLNGYQIGGVQECKWILLIIDDVYEMIKHSEQTKLKGMQYSRQYEFRTEKKEKIQLNEVNT